MEPVIYVVDESDTIVEVNEEWHRFFRENSDRPDGQEYVGKNLLDAIGNDEIKFLYRSLMRSVRDQGNPKLFNFRCDSPQTIREFEMRMTGGSDDSIIFESSFLFERPRPQPLFARFVPNTGVNILAVCAWCGKIRSGGNWIETEEAMQQLNLMRSDVPLRFSHSICSDCGIKWRAMIGA